jgi:hypothetical protein
VRLRARRVSWCELDGEAVVLDLGNSKYLSVNSTGTLLLRRLSEGDCTRGDLMQALIAEYGITADQARTDVERFVADLRGRELLDGD